MRGERSRYPIKKKLSLNNSYVSKQITMCTCARVSYEQRAGGNTLQLSKHRLIKRKLNKTFCNSKFNDISNPCFPNTIQLTCSIEQKGHIFQALVKRRLFLYSGSRVGDIFLYFPFILIPLSSLCTNSFQHWNLSLPWPFFKAFIIIWRFFVFYFNLI